MHLIALHDTSGFRKGIIVFYLMLSFVFYSFFIDFTIILIIWLNIFDFLTIMESGANISSVRSRAAYNALRISRRGNSNRRKFLNSNVYVRSYSCTSSVINKPCIPSIEQSTLEGNSLKDFYEWFVGLADAESSFYIKKVKESGFEFEFKISLHVDDLEVLSFIQKTLGIGKIDVYGKLASFRVRKTSDFLILFEIFDKFTLNSTKYLNYLDFKKAFELYKSSESKSFSIIESISQIKNGMNTQRTDFSMPESHKLRITPYCVLGFVEGEGCFSVQRNKNFPLTFSLTQKNNSALLKAIQDFFISLGKSRKWRNYDSTIVLSSDKRISSNPGEINCLYINRIDYITNVLIPFFDSLTWHSKKEKDYKDWKTILELKKLGLHYVEEGVRVINLIISQMNVNRSCKSQMSQSQIDAPLRTKRYWKIIKWTF